MPPIREQLGYLAAHVSMVQAMMAGMEAEGSMRGEYWGCRQALHVFSSGADPDLYPRVINTLRDLAGGALIMLPSSIHDFNDPSSRGSSA